MNRVLNYAVIAASALIMTNTQVNAAVINLTDGSTSGYTMTDGNTYVVRNSVTFSNSTAGGSGITVDEGATVVIFIPTNITLTAIGANGSGRTGGGAGIRVPDTATLIITGEGIVNATGGNAGDGVKGQNGRSPSYDLRPEGGAGGDGGGGGGTGIGGVGGLGGEASGGAGYKSESMGCVYVLGAMNVNAFKGSGGNAGERGLTYGSNTGSGDWYYSYGGGGGGGGAGSPATFAIGVVVLQVVLGALVDMEIVDMNGKNREKADVVEDQILRLEGMQGTVISVVRQVLKARRVYFICHRQQAAMLTGRSYQS